MFDELVMRSNRHSKYNIILHENLVGKTEFSEPDFPPNKNQGNNVSTLQPLPLPMA